MTAIRRWSSRPTFSCCWSILSRFYDRQFITRHKVNSEIVAQFERMLKEYYDSPDTKEAMPAVSYFADKLCLTPKYLSELVKRETGMTTKVLITQHLVNVAKHSLAVSNDDVGMIAYKLGFQYPAHFSRMFRRHTGLTPSEFRQKIVEQNWQAILSVFSDSCSCLSEGIRRSRNCSHLCGDCGV